MRRFLGRRGMSVAIGLIASVAARPAMGQKKAVADTGRRCQLVIERVDRQGVRTETSPGVENLFAGGNVHVRCRGQNIHIYSDSLASYGGNVVQFIGSVRYRDSTTALDADFGQYFKAGEHFDAQGNVNHRDLKSGSTIVGPRVDYYRPLPNVRPEFEIQAYSRPTIHFVVRDSLNRPTDPYIIVANKVKTVGSDQLYAGGDVTIDRTDLKGKSDSLWIDAAKAERGQMLGKAELHGNERDSFDLKGKDIDLSLVKRELTGLKAKVKANLTSKDVTLDADSIKIDLVQREVEVIRAWGKGIRPKALSGEYLVLGDSLVIETPQQVLKTVRAYGSGWAGFRPDSNATDTKRDWIAGETVVAMFVQRDSAGVKKSAIQQLEAEEKARSYYQMAPEKGQTKGSINYTRADKIVVTMKVTDDSTTVDRVDAHGNVDGIHLQPAQPKRDSTGKIIVTDSLGRPIKPDSIKADTTKILMPKAKPDTTKVSPPRDTAFARLSRKIGGRR